MNARIGPALMVFLVWGLLYSNAQQDGEDAPLNPKLVRQAVEMLKSKDVQERRMGAFTLARAGAGSADALTELSKALSDTDDIVRFHSVQAMGKLGPKAKPALQALLQMLTEGRSEFSRPCAVALARIGKDSVDPLSRALTAENPRCRSMAAISLAMIGADSASAGPALAKALSDDSFRVRRSAAEALCYIQPRPDDVIPSLLRTLETDSDADVCLFTALALGKLGPPALPVLKKSLKSEQANLRYHAARSLGFMGKEGASALKDLQEARKDSDPEVRAAVEDALRRSGGLDNK